MKKLSDFSIKIKKPNFLLDVSLKKEHLDNHPEAILYQTRLSFSTQEKRELAFHASNIKRDFFMTMNSFWQSLYK